MKRIVIMTVAAAGLIIGAGTRGSESRFWPR
jgi:hypothetical protein